jgi:hypothetical protein
MLIYFYDILVYIYTFEMHLQHFMLELGTLKKNQLFTKKLMCFFIYEKKIEYLGYIIFTEGVVVNLKKIELVKN